MNIVKKMNKNIVIEAIKDCIHENDNDTLIKVLDLFLQANKG